MVARVWDGPEGKVGEVRGEREWSSTMIHHHGAQRTSFLGNAPASTPRQQFGRVPESDKVTLALFSVGCSSTPVQSNHEQHPCLTTTH